MKECESCGYITELKEYTSGYGPKLKKMEFCFLCAGTFAGNAAQYPDLYDNKDVLQAICFIGNEILKQLKPSPSDKEKV